MKEKDILAALNKIKALASHDYEAAHVAEDELHIEVLEAISAGTLERMEPHEAAYLALESTKIKFGRVCA